AADDVLNGALCTLGDQFFSEMQMLPGTQFDAPDSLDRISDETVLENTAAGLCRIVTGEAGTAIEFPGNRVGGPHRITAALEFVAGATRFAVRDMSDDLNTQAKLVLVRRLVREGLLAVVVPDTPVEKIVSAAGNEAMTAGSPMPLTDESAWETLILEQIVQ